MICQHEVSRSLLKKKTQIVTSILLAQSDPFLIHWGKSQNSYSIYTSQVVLKQIDKI